MRRNGILVTLMIISLTALASPGLAANHVRIDTISNVAPGATNLTIGVYVENDVAVNGFVMPLEIRTWSGGAYIAGATFTRGLNPAGRMNLSPLGAADPGGLWPAGNATNRTFAATVAPTGCNRRIADDMGNSWNTAAALPDFSSPDAVFMGTVSTGDPNIGELTDMEPGSDPAGVPSYRIICNVGVAQGVFIIDTTCIAPANHLVFTRQVEGVPVFVTPTFQHGIIGVGVIAGVKELETGVIPQDYALEQNYPNPFNAGTVIRFQQPTDGNVKIDVYNILGRKVRTLVDEFRAAGNHQTDWNGRSDDGVEVATGVYFYRITADRFTSTRKMVLLK
jgi:hypothetical protein